MTFLEPMVTYRGRSSAASGPELDFLGMYVLFKFHDLSQNFRSAHMQMKKMLLYYMARALKEHPEILKEHLERKSGRIVMTDDHSKGGFRPVHSR
jgi:hypothetical protein